VNVTDCILDEATTLKQLISNALCDSDSKSFEYGRVVVTIYSKVVDVLFCKSRKHTSKHNVELRAFDFGCKCHSL